MSAPLVINKDDLRAQEFFNFSAIDQYWQDRGYTEDYLRIQYKLITITSFVYTFGLISLYYAAYSTRKKISLAKRLGEEAGTRWETFCSDFELGQAATINFVSSCLMTNDRVYLVLRLILAVWSFTITLSTFAGARSLILGAYFPLATILTVHINLKRHLIVEGFGTKMQSVNKFLHWLFSCQIGWQLFVTLHWWTKWFGPCRYKDMVKPFDRSRAILLQEEFTPLLFFLTEMLWFDTDFDFPSCLHPVFMIGLSCLQFLWNAFKKNGGSANPQLLIKFKENPAATIWQTWMTLFLFPCCGIPVVIFYKTKMWIFMKIPVIRERLQIRMQCVEIFRKRTILNKFLPKEMVKNRKSAGRRSYSSIGRTTENRNDRMEIEMRKSYSRSRRTTPVPKNKTLKQFSSI